MKINPSLLDGAGFIMAGDDNIDFMFKLAKTLDIANSNRFISTEHCSNIFKHHLRDLNIDVPQKPKKGGE